MEFKECGFTFNIEKEQTVNISGMQEITGIVVSGKYGVIKSYTLSGGISEEDKINLIAKFVESHTVYEQSREDRLKFVAYDYNAERYIQIQALKDDGETYIIQEYDDELDFEREVKTTCRYREEAVELILKIYSVEKCLDAEVYRSQLGDCTNGGVSSSAKSLYVLGSKGPTYPNDIRKCVVLQRRRIGEKTYVNAVPAYKPKLWYMMGGNFLYSSDSRFREFTGIDYPVAIHDRHEGR